MFFIPSWSEIGLKQCATWHIDHLKECMNKNSDSRAILNWQTKSFVRQPMKIFWVKFEQATSDPCLTGKSWTHSWHSFCHLYQVLELTPTMARRVLMGNFAVMSKFCSFNISAWTSFFSLSEKFFQFFLVLLLGVDWEGLLSDSSSGLRSGSLSSSLISSLWSSSEWL